MRFENLSDSPEIPEAHEGLNIVDAETFHYRLKPSYKQMRIVSP